MTNDTILKDALRGLAAREGLGRRDSDGKLETCWSQDCYIDDEVLDFAQAVMDLSNQTKPMKLKIKKLHPDAKIPQYATEGAACFDLCAVDIDPMWGRALSDTPTIIRTGLAFEVPPGYVLKIYSRSGHGFKHGIRLSNCVGIIDSDYRGEVQIALTQDDGGSLWQHIESGDRIAQAMLEPAPQVEFEEVEDLSDTLRGAGGFGSTGT
jgi:dUTP pyrophosphatase